MYHAIALRGLALTSNADCPVAILLKPFVAGTE